MKKSEFEDYTLKGVGAIVIKPNVLVSDRRCVIRHFDSRVNKYKVDVEGRITNFIAWYTLEELRLDDGGEKK